MVLSCLSGLVIFGHYAQLGCDPKNAGHIHNYNQVRDIKTWINKYIYVNIWYAHGHWPDVNVCRVSCWGVVNILLVLSIISYFHYNIWACMCSTGPFQYRWLKGFICSSCHYHHQIGSIHLSHCYYNFPWLCVWDVCYIIFCYLLHIYSEKTGNLFLSLLCSLWRVQIVGYVLSWRSYSFLCTLHHLIFIIVQTYLKTLNL